MTHRGSRFVLICQQTLAVAVVAAVAVPAADMVTLDIVAPPKQAAAAGASSAPAPASDIRGSAVVASRPVQPRLRNVALTGVSPAGLRAVRRQPTATHGAGAQLVSAAAAGRTDDLAVLSPPKHVGGLATVGVTWAGSTHVPDGDITVWVRTRAAQAWSTWHKVPYHADEGPDPSSPEGRAARPGTDPIYVGKVDDVQVKAVTSTGRAPRGMRLALVDPGTQQGEVQKPAIDTDSLHLSSASIDPADQPDQPDQADQPAADLTAAKVTSKPKIYSRAQWGADERMRDRSSLHYGEVHGGFVHHTVNANSYSRSQVPALIRGIYAYHTQSRGWSDIGYNFLVDRFGRIWEGRAGGVDRPVVGAHTLGYNDDSFAMSAIGNFQVARPPSAVVRAFGRLFAWKLSLHGVRASATHQWIEKRYLPAINGHRDVGQTACPGKYLYAKIPRIRRLAAAYQRSWSARTRDTDIAGSSSPDLVARDRATKRAVIIRTAGAGHRVRLTRTSTVLPQANLLMTAGDWNGDGHADVVTRSRRTGLLFLYLSNGKGAFSKPRAISKVSFARVRMLAAVGDMTGDGRPDLMGQPKGGSMRIYPGRGTAGLRHSYVAHSWLRGMKQLGVGRWTSDGAPDSVLRRRDGSLVLYPGNGPGGLTSGKHLGRIATYYDWVVATGDVTGDGRADVVTRAPSTGRLWLLRGSSTGFGHRRLVGTSMGRFDLAG